MTTAAVAAARPRVLADLVPGASVRDAGMVLGGAALTGAAAQLAVHTSLTPVPFTLQTLSVLVVGASLGPVRALLAMLTYLAAGLAGVPWFAGHEHGFAGNPSFGYLLGFVLGAAVIGRLAQQRNDRRVLSALGAFAVAEIIVFAVGTAYLAVDLHLSAAQAIAAGVTPFVVAEVAKVLVASLVLPTAWRLVRR